MDNETLSGGQIRYPVNLFKMYPSYVHRPNIFPAPQEPFEVEEHRIIDFPKDGPGPIRYNTHFQYRTRPYTEEERREWREELRERRRQALSSKADQ